MKKNRFLFRLVLITLLLAGCAKAPAEEEAASEPLRIAAVLPGRIDDGQFNQQMYDGLMALKEKYGDQIEVSYVEGVYNVVDIEPAIRDYAEKGYDLVIGHGFQYQDPIMAVAPDFPDVNFAIGPGAYMVADNVVTYDADNVELGYALGVASGLATETDFIAGVYGAEAPNVLKMDFGYKAGAMEVNPEVRVEIVYVASFEDLEGAREASIALIDEGADVIFGVMNNVAGTMEAAKSEGVYGVLNSDVSSTYPETLLASIKTEYGVAIDQMIQDIRAGSFGNKQYFITFENGGLSAKLHQSLTESAREEFESIMSGLTDGSIEVPRPE